jgi:hypothetical protein
VVAGISAISDPDFGLHGPSASTHGAAILMIVIGPIADDIGLNSGQNKQPHGLEGREYSSHPG